MSTRWAWRILFTARISRMKRRTELASRACAPDSTLMAATFPVAGCTARYTVPMPPAPIFSSTRYSPICMPRLSAVSDGSLAGRSAVTSSSEGGAGAAAGATTSGTAGQVCRACAWPHDGQTFAGGAGRFTTPSGACSGQIGDVEIELDGPDLAAVVLRHRIAAEQPLDPPHVVDDRLRQG